MRIALDAMGGDNAPDEIIEGALLAAEELDKDDELLLVGPEDVLLKKIGPKKLKKSCIRLVNATEIIAMDEPPVEAIRRKKNSSIAIMAKLASKGEADAVISAGNTGACVAACQLRMRNLPGVNRPGIVAVMPTFSGPVAVCDVGANISCKPINLYQYAVMSSIYIKEMYGIDNPRIGLMSIGEEDSKGNVITKRTRELLRGDSSLNFIGNIEGRDIFKDVCDVAICEGFVGNIILKLTEGLVNGMFKAIRHELKQENILFALKFKKMMKRFYKKYDYHEYGGALLLGVNGTSVICHGSSEARTIKNAVLASKRFTAQHINDRIVDHLSNSTVENTDE